MTTLSYKQFLTTYTYFNDPFQLPSMKPGLQADKLKITGRNHGAGQTKN